jgi:hypothetical protein
MARTAKKSELGREPFRRPSDSEALLFVTRTLQPQLDDTDAPNDLAGAVRRDAAVCEAQSA